MRQQSLVYKPGKGTQQHNSAARTKALKVQNVKLCYASFTAAGSNGDHAEDGKDNQDCWVIQSSPPHGVAGLGAPASGASLHHHHHHGGALLFGVMDGHGQHGGPVAAVAAERLPQNVFRSKHFQVGDHEAALSDAYQATQADLSQQPGLDCDMSGCTATTALLVDDVLVVANAGDSRCIIGRLEDANEAVAYETTNDHTPCLMAEANRVLAAGGRIATFEYNGERIGPPRVWERHADLPGLCVTRSLGDHAAKRLGVVATPEVITYALAVNDRYLILVSDGITEFLGSQEIVDRVHGWASEGATPDEVARRLVLEARALWRSAAGSDGIIDDCTAVVAYLVYDPDHALARASKAGSGRMLEAMLAGGEQRWRQACAWADCASRAVWSAGLNAWAGQRDLLGCRKAGHQVAV